MTPFVSFEASAEVAANRERELIEEKMNLWIEAIDALNAECRAFSYNYFNKDHSENFITKKERLMEKLKTAEKIVGVILQCKLHCVRQRQNMLR